MGARAIRRILASSPRAAGPRASANIMTYSPRTHAITSLLHDEVPIYHTGIVVSAIYHILHSGTFELVGYHATKTNIPWSANSFPIHVFSFCPACGCHKYCNEYIAHMQFHPYLTQLAIRFHPFSAQVGLPMQLEYEYCTLKSTPLTSDVRNIPPPPPPPHLAQLAIIHLQ